MASPGDPTVTPSRRTKERLLSGPKGRFSLRRFYQRRIARIFPVFFLVAAATIVAAWFLYSTQDLASAGVNLAAATLSLANVKYMLQDNYFEISKDAQPYLHYWSLSVEEQFYMAYPLVLFVLRRWIRKRSLQFGLLAAALVVSLALCIGLTMKNPTWAFYLLPTRGWELLAGGLLAIWSANGWPWPGSRVRGVLGVAGLVMVLASFVVLGESPQFPGFLAALPVVGTCLIIANDPASKSVVERGLGTRPMVTIGKLSYSIYLWHWPIFSFTDYALYTHPEPTRIAIKVGLTVVCTLASYFLVEKRARAYLNEDRRWVLAFASVAVLGAAFVGAGVTIRGHFFLDAKPSSVAAGGLHVRSGPSGERTGGILLMGDSNATMYGTTLREVAGRLALPLDIVAAADGYPLPNPSGQPHAIWNDSLAAARALRPATIIYVLDWTGKFGGDRTVLPIALEQIAPLAERIILITQPANLRPGSTREAIRSGASPVFVEDPGVRRRRLEANDHVRTLAGPGVRVIDIESIFSRPDGTIIYAAGEGRFLYQDTTHLSGDGAMLVLPQILEALSAP